MSLDWQTAVALTLVAGAGLFVARTVWFVLRAKSNCGGGCKTCASAGPREVFTLAPPGQRPREERPAAP